ncbi:MAG TPA: enolase C-terminal domain-like protein [Acetobacteraceae bacterium]|nr:enolase C-terminal domain-like protein [Acetobacteraceae bacterium]
MQNETAVTRLVASAYTIPTDAPEADGTLAWDETTIVVVQAEAGGRTGIGYTYSDKSNADLIGDKLAPLIVGRDAYDIGGALLSMQRHVRNLGRSGLAATAISAVDAALWDLKAKLLDVPLAKLIGMVRTAVPVYGSGGFTSYSNETLQAQLACWVEREGCRWVKMKVGSDPDVDPERVAAARSAIGLAGLFVDANGAFSRKRALTFADICADFGVCWFEEPVSSDDIRGLRLLRDRVPAPMEIAAGEYAYSLDDVRRTLESGAVDVQQVDASRCGGISGFLAAGQLCEAYHTDLSAHCAPSLHVHVACAVPRFRHQEYFHDHVRIEQMLFDGAARARDGVIAPDLSRPGLGLEFKQADAARYAT